MEAPLSLVGVGGGELASFHGQAFLALSISKQEGTVSTHTLPPG